MTDPQLVRSKNLQYMWQESSGLTRLNMAIYAREVGSGSEKSLLKGTWHRDTLLT